MRGGGPKQHRGQACGPADATGGCHGDHLSFPHKGAWRHHPGGGYPDCRGGQGGVDHSGYGQRRGCGHRRRPGADPGEMAGGRGLWPGM